VQRIDGLAGARTDNLSTTETRAFHRQPLTDALTDNLLGTLATTDRTETTASTGNFLGAFGLTDNLERRVQGLDAEPANGSVHPPQTSSRTQLANLIRSGATELLGRSVQACITIPSLSLSRLINFQ